MHLMIVSIVNKALMDCFLVLQYFKCIWYCIILYDKQRRIWFQRSIKGKFQWFQHDQHPKNSQNRSNPLITSASQAFSLSFYCKHMNNIPTVKMLQSLAKMSDEQQQEYINNIYLDAYDYRSLGRFGVRVELMPFFSMRDQLVRIIQRHKTQRNRLCFLLPMTQYPGRGNANSKKRKELGYQQQKHATQQQVKQKEQRGLLSRISSIFSYFNPLYRPENQQQKRTYMDNQNQEQRQSLNKKNE